MNIKSHIFSCVIAATLFSAQVLSHNGEKHDKPANFNGLETPAAKTVLAFHNALETSDKITARKLLADDVLIFEGGVERSADQYANHHMLADMKYLAAVDTKTLEHTVKVTANLAVSMSRSKTTGSYKGKEKNYIGMETMVLEKQNGQWKIIHIHWSN